VESAWIKTESCWSPGPKTIPRALLASRFLLPAKCLIRYTLSDVVKDAHTFNGIYLGAAPSNPGAPSLVLGRTSTAAGQSAITVSGVEPA